MPRWWNFSSVTGADAPKLAHWQRRHELSHLFRLYLELAVRLLQIACNLGHELVRTNPGGSGQFSFLKNQIADDLGERAGRAGMRGDIEVSFIE